MKNFVEKIVNKIQNYYFTQRGLHKYNSSTIREYVYIDVPQNVFVGKCSSINPFCTLQIGATRTARIMIGDEVAIASHCKISCITHEIGPLKRRAGTHLYRDVIIEDGCWIGLNVTIIAGVKIAKGCVIGAGSVVIHDTEPNSLYAGVPAKKIRSL